MTTKALTLAALVIAAGTLSSAAEAGGVRLQFGGPLGSFVAHPHLSSGPGGTARGSHYAHKPSYAKPSYVGRLNHDDAPARKAVRHKPKIDVAEEAPRRVVKKAPKVEVAERAPVVVRKVKKAPAVKIAKVEDPSVTTDAAPSIFVPDSPPAAASGFTGTQSTPAAVRTAEVTVDKDATDAGLAPEDKTEVVVLPVIEDEAKSEAAEPADSSVKVSEIAEKICRRFSAALGSLINVPCE